MPLGNYRHKIMASNPYKELGKLGDIVLLSEIMANFICQDESNLWNIKIFRISSTYLNFSDLACILNVSQLAMRRLTTISCIKNQSEIYCIIPSVLLKMKRFKYHASIVEFKKCCWTKMILQ
jgi:hypothetical protein